MTNHEKERLIRPWVDPKERVTVHFPNSRDLHAEVIGCTDQLVTLLIETSVPYMNQCVPVPLGQIDVSEDLSRSPRDQNHSPQRRRLMLVVREKRPPIIY